MPFEGNGLLKCCMTQLPGEVNIDRTGVLTIQHCHAEACVHDLSHTSCKHSTAERAVNQ